MCRETNRATTDPKPQMKRYRQDASTGVVIQDLFLFFGKFFFKYQNMT